MKKVYDAIIIGAGPAGISSAIQLKRYGIDFLLIEKNCIGGLLKNASLVENYPGFPGGISGLKLISLFKKHLSVLGIRIKKETVLNVASKQNKYFVRTEKAIYNSKYLVTASGTKPKKFIAGGSSAVDIYYDVYELFDVRKKDIVVIGGGDAAFDYAVSLGRCGNSVSIVHRGSKPGCNSALLRIVSKMKNISYFCDLKIERIHKEKKKIIIDCGGNKIFNADYLVAAIGREEQLDFIRDEEMKIFNKKKGETVFFVGDVKNGICRQAGIGIGEGIKAAMIISKKLKLQNENNC